MICFEVEFELKYIIIRYKSWLNQMGLKEFINNVEKKNELFFLYLMNLNYICEVFQSFTLLEHVFKTKLFVIIGNKKRLLVSSFLPKHHNLLWHLLECLYNIHCPLEETIYHKTLQNLFKFPVQKLFQPVLAH